MKPTPTPSTVPTAPGILATGLRRDRHRRLWLAVEILVIFVALPTAFRLQMIGVPLILGILVLAVCSVALLLADKRFDRRRFWRSDRARREWPRILKVFAVAAFVGSIAVALLMPKQFLQLVQNRPDVWLMVMVLYPIFSVYPQEVIFRGFFFHRYRELFRRPWALIAASAAVFGYVHIVMGNGWAIGLSAIGGVLFGLTYLRSRSLLAVAAEHALYGCFIFTVGLGRYFYFVPGG